MAQADGSVIIDTKMNNDALEKGFERLKSDCESLGITCEKAGDKIKASFFDIDIPANIQNAVAKLTTLQDKLASSIENSGETAKMAVEAEKKLIAAQTELAKLEQEKAPIEQILKTDEYIDPATYIEAYEKIDKLNGKIIEQEKAVKQLQGEYSKIAAEADRAASMEEKTYAQVEAAQRRLTQVISSEANKRATAEERAQIKATKAAEREAAKKKKAQEKAYNDATKGAKKFGNRLSRILSGALIFNAISSGLRQLTSYFGTAMKKNADFSASFAKLKGAFLTAVQPIYELLLPAMITLMNILTKVMQGVSRFASLLTGKSTAQMSENAKALYEQASATEAVGDAADKAKRQVAGFDQITKLNSSDESANSSTSNIVADFDQEAVPEIDLDKMITYTSGALLALGVILTFTGANIPLGLGMIAIGVAGLATEISANWDCMGDEVGKAINIVLGALAVGGLVIGAILTFSGANLPLGIALMAVGAASLATMIALNWNTIKEKLQGPIGIVTAIVSAALLVIGAILAFSGVALPLGIGLMAAGAIGLATVTALNWGSIVSSLRGTTGKIVAVVSTALLALGAILAFTGVGIPLGIGLMAAGAVGLAATAAVNWDTIKQKVTAVFAGILAIISGMSIVLGVLLCLSGAGLGLGLALIFAGLAGTKKAWSLSDNPVTRFVKNLANGVIGIINSIAEAINDLFHIKFDGLKIGGVQIIPSFDTQLLRLPTIPKLAQGAVLPANQPFLAMVGDQKHGTNVEAPLETIQEAVALVMEDMTNGMMAGFEALLEENQRLRTIVEGIEVGDSTIGQAANRYNQRMAIIRG